MNSVCYDTIKTKWIRLAQCPTTMLAQCTMLHKAYTRYGTCAAQGIQHGLHKACNMAYFYFDNIIIF